ncbi:MAG TPA: hypothetical protein VMT04_03020 [Terriglobales bacterium]|nr:hypothetical protein [Terriglobales bacterium]
MKTFISWLSKQLLPSIIVLILGFTLNYLISHPYFPVYGSTFRTEIIIGLIFLILLVILLYFVNWHWQRIKDFKGNFQVYKPVSRLEPSDFGIFTFYPFYLTRESDREIEKSLKDKNVAFITGMPNSGKTRAAYEIAKKLKDLYLLRPAYQKLEIHHLKFPFFKKNIVLFLDDLEKYSYKLNLDELIDTLKKNSRELKIIATCRSGKECDQVLGQKEMVNLLFQCQSNRIEMKKLSLEEERELASEVGRKPEEVVSDGTPGSVVFGLNQMGKKYPEPQRGPKAIPQVIKRLGKANIFGWTEKLVKKYYKK